MAEKYMAIETEYKGVIFRSKSEALLARSFDLNGFLWEYEPCMYGNEKNMWLPDFRLMIKIRNYLYEFIVEYKPSIPTETYAKRLLRNYREYFINHDWTAPELMLICGSFFDESKQRIVMVSAPGEDDFGYSMHKHLIISNWDEARKYRFDLQNGGR